MGDDKGLRSVEINLSNMSGARFTVLSSHAGEGSGWLSGETPVTGSLLGPWQSLRLGVMTTEATADAAGRLVLDHEGHDFSVIFINSSQGLSSCKADTAGAPEVSATVQEQDSGEMNHSLFDVTLGIGG